ncbi:MAG: hypothetical protein AB8C95_10460 [Phycisphaeraceae bacterium]
MSNDPTQPRQPNQPGQPQTYYYQPQPTNGLGIAGFVISLSGMIVCMGLICPLGLLLSLIALTKEPRGFAIAGSIIGLLGSILGTLTALMVTGVIGSGLFWGSFSMNLQTSMTIDSASYDIDNHFANNNNTIPDEPTGNTIISGYTDEWNNFLKYEPTQGSTTDYTITSAGPDGLFATSDDVMQYYTASNWSSQAFADIPEDEVDGDQIEAAFNLAAKKIVESFPAEAALPTADQVAQNAGTLVDAWLTPMNYSPTDNPPYYRLESAGPDQQWGTKDDLTRSFYFAPTGDSDGPL